MPSTTRSGRSTLGLAFLLFFASGFAALVYQVVWQRILALFSGVDVFSITIIVAAFMGGLGAGSLLGGHLADRLTPRRALLAFAVAETAIASFAVLSKWLYYDVLYLRLPDLSGSPVVLSVTLFTALLLPTSLMGASLPLLSRALTRTIEGAASVVGTLYAVNTLGAAVGSFSTVWVLMRHVDFEGCLLIGAGLNLFCALSAVAVSGRFADKPLRTPAPPGDDRSPARPLGPLSFRHWAALYALSGFNALSLEILWFRILGVMLKSSAFTFGTLLGVFLTGLALGTALGTLWSRVSRRPARAFLALQAGVPIYAGLSLGLFINRVDDWPSLRPLFRYFGQYDPLEMKLALSAVAPYVLGIGADGLSPASSAAAGQLALLYVLLPLALMGPPTLLMGLSFPLLQKVVQTDPAFVGRRVGFLQTANIAGSMLGAILTGFLLLDLLGSSASLRFLVVLGATFAVVLVMSQLSRGRRAALSSVFLVVAAAAALAPGRDRLWAKLHGSEPGFVLVEEDATGVAVVRNQSAHFPPSVPVRSTMFSGGLGQGEIPFDGLHRWLGFLPTMIHPAPEDVAIIGLGSGNTLFFAGSRPETGSITCIEIVEPQLRALSSRNERQEYPGLASVFTDERVRFVFTDARAFIARGDRRYDVIEADALRPGSAYAGNLYSREYFLLLREHLKPGGLAVSWAPTPRAVRTFFSAFPHVLFFHELGILVGSNEPIPFDPAVLRARMEHPFTHAYFLRLGRNGAFWLERAKSQALAADRELPEGAPADLNRDLFPRDEYLIPELRSGDTR